MDKLSRLLFILEKLIEKEYSVSELETLLTEQFQLEGEARHGIKLDIERIEKLGFILSKEKKGRKNKFKINKTPFKYKLNEEEQELIKDIFANYSNNTIALNSFFDNISSLLHIDLKEIIPKEDFSKYKNKDIYSKVKKVLQQTIHNSNHDYRKVRFKYLSAYNHSKNKDPLIHEVFPIRIERGDKKTERVRIYNNYGKLSILNLDSIMTVPEVLDEFISHGEVSTKYNKAQFKLYPPASRNYHLLKDEEKIIYDKENEIVIIKTPYYTSFELIQKVMKYGECAEIISPPEARREIKEKIDKLQDIYK